MTAVQAGQVTGGCAAPPPVSLSRPARGYASGKEDYLRRLRKIEGQVRGLQKMIENDTWCPDVVTQVASATRALQEVAVGSRPTGSCPAWQRRLAAGRGDAGAAVGGARPARRPPGEKVREASDAIARLVRS